MSDLKADRRETNDLEVGGNSAEFGFLHIGSILGPQAHKLGHLADRRTRNDVVRLTSKACKDFGEHRDVSSSALNMPKSFRPYFQNACSRLWLMLALTCPVMTQTVLPAPSAQELQALTQPFRVVNGHVQSKALICNPWRRRKINRNWKPPC